MSWYDAAAFCEWLSSQHSEKIVLPSETEWEAAAHGTDGRKFPWGLQQPDINRCNFDRYIGTPTPVGIYPAGASPFGCLDMSGNVWEWTRSKNAPYPYRSDDGREDAGHAFERVIRGGAFDLDVNGVRSAVRYGDTPDRRAGDIGFRVVTS